MGQTGSGLSGPGVKGLKNLDSTCYMNVGLQCLFQTPGLTRELIEWQSGAAGDEPAQAGGLRGGKKAAGESVVSSYVRLAQKVWDPEASEWCVSPGELKSTIDRLDPRYKGVTEQRDALDFFIHVFIRHLHNDIKRPFALPPTDCRPSGLPESPSQGTGTAGREEESKRDPGPTDAKSAHALSVKNDVGLSSAVTKSDEKTKRQAPSPSSSSSHPTAPISIRVMVPRDFSVERGENARESRMPSRSSQFADLSLESKRLEPLRRRVEAMAAPPPPPTPTLAELAARAWRKHVATTGSSFFTENFQGQTLRTATCRKCKRQSMDFPAFQFIQLAPSPRAKSVRLVDLLRKMPLRHDLRKRWRCEHCRAKGKVIKNSASEQVFRLPNILMVLLQRVAKNTKGRCVKTTTEVVFPLRGLDLTGIPLAKGVPSVDGNGGAGEHHAPGWATYDLFSVLSHSGTPRRGHYVAHARNVRTGDWHTFNDGRIRVWPTPGNVVRSRDAYVLFYTRRAYADATARAPAPDFQAWREKNSPQKGRPGFGFIANSRISAPGPQTSAIDAKENPGIRGNSAQSEAIVGRGEAKQDVVMKNSTGDELDDKKARIQRAVAAFAPNKSMRLLSTGGNESKGKQLQSS